MENRYQNIAIFFLVLAGLILLLVGKQGNNLKVGGLIALAVLFLLTLIFPLAGMVLAIMVFVVAYFDNSRAVWDWWSKARETVVNLKQGG